jgi:hypothetical protein
LKFLFLKFWISIFELARNSTPARNSGFWKFWISIFELAWNTNPAQNSGFQNFEFRSSSWLEIQHQLEIRLFKVLNFDLRSCSKFNASSKWNSSFWKFWISIFELTRNSTSARISGFSNFQFRSSSWLEIQLQLEIRVLKILNFDLRAGSKFNSSSKFSSGLLWISIFELARSSKLDQYSLLTEFRSSIFDVSANFSILRVGVSIIQ